MLDGMEGQAVESEQTRIGLSRAIKEQAHLLGFDKIGIVRAERLNSAEQRLKEWLDRGYHGEMHWMARDSEARADPLRLLPSAKSVVVLALNYHTHHKHTEGTGTGKISCYAWGDDYHSVMTEKLRKLFTWLQQQAPQVEGWICVDIQPMMDKAWAERAGLGWIGKHTNLITPEFGSWVFLGELLLNVELDCDAEAIEDHCGTCTLCIDACPTDAITQPYVLDSNKCISYATIELRAPDIPTDVASKLEGWLYGCDICQDVCPWNRFEQETSERCFEPRPGNVDASLEDIIELKPESYADRFRNSAMKRAKLSGLQRNARQLLANRLRSAALPPPLRKASGFPAGTLTPTRG